MIYKSQPVDFIMYKNGKQGPAGQGLSGQYDFYAATNSMFTSPNITNINGTKYVDNLTNLNTIWYTKTNFFTVDGQWDTKKKVNDNPYVWKITCIVETIGNTFILASGPVLLSDLEAATLATAAQLGSGENEDTPATLIATWCQRMGKTIIDGSTIVTGSIGANQIKANAIDATKINADSIGSAVFDSTEGQKFVSDTNKKIDDQNKVIAGQQGQIDAIGNRRLWIVYSAQDTKPNKPNEKFEADEIWHTTLSSGDRWQSQRVANALDETLNSDESNAWSAVIQTSGKNAPTLQLIYKYSDKIPTTPTGENPSEWSTTEPTPVAEQRLYMSQKMSDQTIWSTPVPMTGLDGVNGTNGTTPEVEIIDGYWYINGEQSIKAEGVDGEDGITPTVTIDPNTNKWVINGTSTNINATGPAGKDGANIEYVYYRSTNAISDWTGKQPNNEEKNGWTKSAQGITDTYKYEYMSVRTKPAGNGTSWGPFSTPVIWSKWGEKGQDGDGVEYKYKTYTTKQNFSSAPTIDNSWKNEPQGVNSTNKYEYVCQLKYDGEKKTTTTSVPKLWNEYVSSPYTLSIDEDFISVPCDSSGMVSSTFTMPTVYVSLYNGQDQQTPDANKLTFSQNDNSIANKGVVNNNKISISLNKNNINADRMTVKLQYKDSSKVLAEAMIEIVKQKAGAPGDPATYIYTVASANIIKKDGENYTPAYFTVDLYKREGSEEPVKLSSSEPYWEVSGGNINSETGSNKGSGASVNIYPNSDDEISIVVYNNSGKSKVIDKLNVNVVKDGDNGNSISYIAEYYAVNNDEKKAPTSWIWVNNPDSPGKIPPVDEKNKYLWNYEASYYSEEDAKEDESGVVSTTNPIVVYRYNKDGTNGDSFSKIEDYYYYTEKGEEKDKPTPPTINEDGTLKVNDWSTTDQGFDWSNKHIFKWGCEVVYKKDASGKETPANVTTVQYLGEMPKQQFTIYKSSFTIPSFSTNSGVPSGWSQTIPDSYNYILWASFKNDYNINGSEAWSNIYLYSQENTTPIAHYTSTWQAKNLDALNEYASLGKSIWFPIEEVVTLALPHYASLEVYLKDEQKYKKLLVKISQLRQESDNSYNTYSIGYLDDPVELVKERFETSYYKVINEDETKIPEWNDGTDWLEEADTFRTWTGWNTNYSKKTKIYKMVEKTFDDGSVLHWDNPILMTDLDAIKLAAQYQIVKGRYVIWRETNSYTFPNISLEYIENMEIISTLNGHFPTNVPEGDIGRWCSLYNRTAISGGAIVTGSITADHIAANAITADKIASDAIVSNNYTHKTDNAYAPPTIDNGGVGIESFVFSKKGTFLDLDKGNLYTPNLLLLGQDGDLVMRGTLQNWVRPCTTEDNNNSKFYLLFRPTSVSSKSASNGLMDHTLVFENVEVIFPAWWTLSTTPKNQEASWTGFSEIPICNFQGKTSFRADSIQDRATFSITKNKQKIIANGKITIRSDHWSSPLTSICIYNFNFGFNFNHLGEGSACINLQDLPSLCFGNDFTIDEKGFLYSNKGSIGQAFQYHNPEFALLKYYKAGETTATFESFYCGAYLINKDGRCGLYSQNEKTESNPYDLAKDIFLFAGSPKSITEVPNSLESPQWWGDINHANLQITNQGDLFISNFPVTKVTGLNPAVSTGSIPMAEWGSLSKDEMISSTDATKSQILRFLQQIEVRQVKQKNDTLSDKYRFSLTTRSLYRAVDSYNTATATEKKKRLDPSKYACGLSYSLVNSKNGSTTIDPQTMGIKYDEIISMILVAIQNYLEGDLISRVTKIEKKLNNGVDGSLSLYAHSGFGQDGYGIKLTFKDGVCIAGSVVKEGTNNSSSNVGSLS